jgi:hypothetical protein
LPWPQAHTDAAGTISADRSLRSRQAVLTRHESVGWAFDHSLPWSENVAAARDAALLEADFVQDTGDLVAMIEWIDEGDVAVAPS